ncbi:MAG: TonB family protein [Prevotellaceae bacterium]|jgi:TonB family protein|nr:TonB family protein [Prevotellaceae bacterium]
MAVAKINIEKKEEEYSLQRKWKALVFVLLFHCAALFSLSKLGFEKTYPPPPLQGIEIAIELELPRPQGISRRNPRQKPIPNPPIINAPGNTAPQTAQVAKRNESTRPAPQPDSKPSELNDQGDVPVEAPEPKIDNRGLFKSTSQGEEDAENPNPVDEKNLYPGVGREDESTRNTNTPIDSDHRQSVTHNLLGRSAVGGFPLPAYNSRQEGKVVVEVSVNQNGKVVKATATGKGSTVNDLKLWKAAEEAALKAKFDIKKDAPIYQIGTITYVFSLK